MSYTHFPRWLRELITELGCWKAIKRTNLNKSLVLKVCQHIPLNFPLMQPGPLLQGCSNKLSDIRIIIAKCDPDCGYWYNQKTPRGFKIRHGVPGGAELPTLGNCCNDSTASDTVCEWDSPGGLGVTLGLGAAYPDGFPFSQRGFLARSTLQEW